MIVNFILPQCVIQSLLVFYILDRIMMVKPNLSNQAKSNPALPRAWFFQILKQLNQSVELRVLLPVIDERKLIVLV